jgi:SMODS-associating 2TM, beta-strand rich effector domain
MTRDGKRIQAAAYIVSTLWSLVLLAAGIHLANGWSKLVSAIPLLVVLLFGAFDNWLWKFALMRKIAGRPLLAGTWVGELTSMQIKDGQEVTLDPTPIYLSVRQSFLAIEICLLSAESKSRSIASLLERNGGHDYTVYYHYTNVPRLAVRDRSPIHSGGARMQVAGISPSHLEGEYWTDRRTRGTFSAKRVTGKNYWTWQEAEATLGNREGGS